VLKPLLVVLGAFAVVGVLMLGGWALTSATPDGPARPAPAAGSDAGRVPAPAPGGAVRRAGERSQPAGDRAQPAEREQEAAIRDDTARARDLARRTRQRSPQSGAAGSATAPRVNRPQVPPPRPAQDDAAAERLRVVEAERRADQLRRAELARRAEAARRAEEAKRAADVLDDVGGGDDEPEGE
jgi:hypothetical protein